MDLHFKLLVKRINWFLDSLIGLLTHTNAIIVFCRNALYLGRSVFVLERKILLYRFFGLWPLVKLQFYSVL
jgi:hypothetical protein